MRKSKLEKQQAGLPPKSIKLNVNEKREWNSSFCQQTNRTKSKNYFLYKKKSSHNLKFMVHSLLPDTILIFQKNRIKLGTTIFLELDCFPSNRGNSLERKQKATKLRP